MANNSLKGFTFIVRFTTAQFKEHTQKLVRRTYLIPPPSAITGFIGAILGLKRNELAKLSEEMWAGAELKSLEGQLITLARIYKLKRGVEGIIKQFYVNRGKVHEEVREILTIKEEQALFRPTYKFAFASSRESLINEAISRLKNLDFEYDVFGGNDYHFVEYIGDVKTASVEASREGSGYCPREYFENIKAYSYSVVPDFSKLKQLKTPLIVPATFLADTRAEYIQVFGAEIITSKELLVVNDGDSKVFVYKVKPFLVM